MDPLHVYPPPEFTDAIYDQVLQKILKIYRKYLRKQSELSNRVYGQEPAAYESHYQSGLVVTDAIKLQKLNSQLFGFLNTFQDWLSRIIPDHRSKTNSYYNKTYVMEDIQKLTTSQKWDLMNRILNYVTSLQKSIARSQQILAGNLPALIGVDYQYMLQYNQRQLRAFDPLASIILSEYSKLGYILDYFTLINSNAYEIINQELATMPTDVTPQNFEMRTKSDINQYEYMMFSIHRANKNFALKYPNIDVGIGNLNVEPSYYPGKLNLNKYAKYYYDQDPSDPNSGNYQRVYYKSDIIDAISRLGFGVTHEDPSPKIMVSDIVLPILLHPNDDITPIVGFDDHERYVRDYDGLTRTHIKGNLKPKFIVYPTTFGRGYPTRKYNRHFSALSYYENIYRSLARTSQHLPWEGFIHQLKQHAQTKARLIASGQLLGKDYNDPHAHGQIIPLRKNTLTFIATYDYQIPQNRLDGLTRLQICQIIHTRVQQIHTDALKLQEINEIRPAFLGHYIPDAPWRKYSANSNYLEHYSELLQLCEKIQSLKESGRIEQYERIYRSELVRHIEELDFLPYFTRPSLNDPAKFRSLDDYPIDRLCKRVIDLIQDQMASRERIAAQDIRYL